MNWLSSVPGSWAFRIIAGLAILVPVPAVLNKFVLKPLLQSLMGSASYPGLANVLRFVIGLILAWTLYVLLYKVLEKRPIDEAGLPGAAKGLSAGFLISAASIILIVGLQAMTGIYAITGTNPGFDWAYSFLFVATLAFLEEIIMRAVLYRIIEKRFGTVVALIVTSLLFGLLHLRNESMTLVSLVTIVLLGAVLGLSFTISKTIWMPSAFHIGWNFTQAVFGTNISGMDFGTFFTSAYHGPDHLTGGVFGIEGSIFAAAALILLFAGMTVLIFRKKLAIRFPGKIRQIE